MVVKIAVPPVCDQECPRRRILLGSCLLLDRRRSGLTCRSISAHGRSGHSWQTVRKSIERVLGVIIGVSLAILVTHFAGLNIWTITLMIFIAQLVGMFLQHRGQYLATQISITRF